MQLCLKKVSGFEQLGRLYDLQKRPFRLSEYQYHFRAYKLLAQKKIGLQKQERMFG
jgi:hypothetical protein